MTKKFAQFLVEVTEHAGNQEISIRDNYSGRFMYGKQTHAVVVDNPLQLISDMVEYVRENIGEYELEDENVEGNTIKTWEGAEVPESEGLKMDNMGRDSVVLY